MKPASPNEQVIDLTSGDDDDECLAFAAKNKTLEKLAATVHWCKERANEQRETDMMHHAHCESIIWEMKFRQASNKYRRLF